MNGLFTTGTSAESHHKDDDVVSDGSICIQYRPSSACSSGNLFRSPVYKIKSTFTDNRYNI